MGQKSTVELLPKDILDEVNKLYRDNATIQQIVDAVAEMGERISHSAMGRHTRKIKKISDKLTRSKLIANAIMAKLGDAPDSKMLRMNVELMHTAITDIITQSEGDEISIDGRGAHDLAKALDHLSRARKTDSETESRIREEAAKDAREAIKKSNVGTEDQREELIAAVDEVLGVNRK